VKRIERKNVLRDNILDERQEERNCGYQWSSLGVVNELALYTYRRLEFIDSPHACVQ
jgi:hypothetical protein